MGIIWINHLPLFTHITHVTAGLLWRNLILLLAVSILPFPTVTLAGSFRSGSQGDEFIALVLYGLIAFLIATSWLLILTYLAAHPELQSDDTHPGFFRAERRRAGFGLLSPPIAIGLGAISPILGLIAYLAIPLFYAITAPESGTQTERVSIRSCPP